MVLYIPPSVLAAEITRRLTPEAWHNIGAAGEPAFQNGWSNSGGSLEPAGFYKDPLGTIHLKGRITAGTTTAGTVVFTLPAGYRPANLRHFSTTSGAGASFNLFVDSAGAVSVSGSVGGTATLEGVRFRP